MIYRFTYAKKHQTDLATIEKLMEKSKPEDMGLMDLVIIDELVTKILDDMAERKPQ